MEATYRTKAIILDCQPWQEVDARIIAYSFDQGKLELTARGAAKLSSKLIGHLQPFNLVDLMVIRGRGVDYAGAADNIAAALNLKQDWEKMRAGGEVLTWYKQLIKPAVSDRQIFLLLAQFIYWLNAINANAAYYQAISRLTVWKLLNLLGLASESAAVRCPATIAPTLRLFARGDLAANLKTWRLTAAEAKLLIKYLDHLLVRLAD